MSKSKLDMLVTMASKLRNAFSINGHKTDGTTDVNINKLAMTEDIDYSPLSIQSINPTLSTGYLTFRTLGNKIDPIVWPDILTYVICTCVFGPDNATLNVVVESTGAMYIYTGTNTAVGWTLKSKVHVNHDDTGMLPVNRIPNIPASRVSTGVLAVDRIPNIEYTKVIGLSNLATTTLRVSTVAPDNSIGIDGDLWGVLE